MKLDLRRRFFKWLRTRVLKLDPGAMMPMWAFYLKCALFPIWAIRASGNRTFFYDPESDTFTIYGMKYTGHLFREFADGGLALNRPFQIVKREDGKITVQSVYGLLLGFYGVNEFRVFMHKNLSNCWRTETFISPELLLEMRDSEAMRGYVQQEFIKLVERGFEALREKEMVHEQQTGKENQAGS